MTNGINPTYLLTNELGKTRSAKQVKLNFDCTHTHSDSETSIFTSL